MLILLNTETFPKGYSFRLSNGASKLSCRFDVASFSVYMFLSFLSSYFSITLRTLHEI